MNLSGELLTYLDGQIMPHSEAMAALQAKGIASVGGFYDTERTFDGRVFRLRQHLERLYGGLAFAKINAGLSLDEMERATERILEDNRRMLRAGEEYTVTQVVSTGEDQGAEAASGVTVVIYCQPLDVGAFSAGYVRGVRLVTPVTYGVPDSATGGSAKGGAQVIPLMTNQEGSITECSGANFMFVRDGRIKLPDRHNVLPGVSMQTVLELADELGLAVDEDDYCTYDVYTADEAFISSTRFCMLPVAAVNGYELPPGVPGPATARLLDAWRDLVGVDFVRRALEHAPDS